MKLLRILALVLLLALPRSADAAWAIDVAFASAFTAGSDTTQAFTYGSAVASGALLVCFTTGLNSTNGVPSGVADGTNGAWTKFGASITGGLTSVVTGWYFQNSAAATPTVTATYTGASTNRGMICGSYTGIATSSAFDVAAGQGQTDPGTGANAVTTGATASTAGNNELAVAFAITQFGQTLTTGTTLAWTQRLSANLGTTYNAHVEDINIATPATVTATWTVGASALADTQSLVGTFRELSAAPRKSLMLLGVGHW